MKSIPRRLLSLLLALSMALSLLSASVWADKAEQDTPLNTQTVYKANITDDDNAVLAIYSYDSDVWTLTVTGSGTLDTLPDTLFEGEPSETAPQVEIDTIAQSAQSLVLSGFSAIGSGVFSEFTGLTSVTFDSSITIGDSAFTGCTGLSSIQFPASVRIGDFAFKGCTSLSTINFPSGTTIGDQAFAGSGLESIDLSGVSSIGIGAFANCTSLTSLDDKSMFGISTISENLFSGCTGLTDITIPDSVTSIGASAFAGCTRLTHITIPGSVSSIGASAFAGSGLKSIIIPGSVSSIGDGAFEDCNSLSSIDIPASVTYIGESAFEDCTSLSEVTFPSSVSVLSDSLFSGCTSLSDDCLAKILANVTEIGDDAFNGCTGLRNPVISDTVTIIGEGAFLNCKKLESVEIPKNVTSIYADNFFYESDNSTDLTPLKITIACYKDSAAYNYAKSVNDQYGKDNKPFTISRLDKEKCPIKFLKSSSKEYQNPLDMDTTLSFDVLIPWDDNITALNLTSSNVDLATVESSIPGEKPDANNKVDNKNARKFKISCTVKAKQSGIATITITPDTAKSKDYRENSATFDIIVKGKTITNKITVEREQARTVQLEQDDVFNLNARCLSGGLTYAMVDSSSPITVDEKGNVKVPAKYVGSAEVTITSEAVEDKYVSDSVIVLIVVNKKQNGITGVDGTKVIDSDKDKETYVSFHPTFLNPDPDVHYSVSPSNVEGLSVKQDSQNGAELTIPKGYQGLITVTIEDKVKETYNYFEPVSKRVRIIVMESKLEELTEEQQKEVIVPGNGIFLAPETNDSIPTSEIKTVEYTTDGVKVDFTRIEDADGYYVYENNKFVIVLDENGTPYLQKLIKQAEGSESEMNTQSAEPILSTQSELDTISFLDTTARDKNKIYKYQIVAFNAEGAGKMSEVKESKLPAPAVTKPSTPSKLTVKTKKQTATVRWKINKKATGYEVQYTTDKKFKKSVKKVTIKKNKTVSTTVKKLTKKKTWYFRIRAYKTVSGKKYYSKWSSAKSVNIK